MTKLLLIPTLLCLTLTACGGGLSISGGITPPGVSCPNGQNQDGSCRSFGAQQQNRLR